MNIDSHITKTLRNHAIAVDAEGTKFIEGAFNYEFINNGDLKIRAYLPDCYDYFNDLHPEKFTKNFKISLKKIQSFSFKKGEVKPAIEISFKISKKGEICDISKPELVDVKLNKTYTNEEFAQKTDDTILKFLSYCNEAFKKNIGEFKNEIEGARGILAPFEYLVKHIFADYAKRVNLPLIEKSNVSLVNDAKPVSNFSFKPALIYGMFNISSLLSHLYENNERLNIFKKNRDNFQSTLEVQEILLENNPFYKNKFYTGLGVQKAPNHTELNIESSKDLFFNSDIFRDFKQKEGIKYHFLSNQSDEYLEKHIQNITRAIFLVPEKKNEKDLNLDKFKASIENLLINKPQFAKKIFDSIFESIPKIEFYEYYKKITLDDKGELVTNSLLRTHLEHKNILIKNSVFEEKETPDLLFYYFLQKFNNSNIEFSSAISAHIHNKSKKINRELASKENYDNKSPNAKIEEVIKFNSNKIEKNLTRIKYIHPEFFDQFEEINQIFQNGKDNGKSSKEIVLSIAKNLGYDLNESVKVKKDLCKYYLNFNSTKKIIAEENGLENPAEARCLIDIKFETDEFIPQDFNKHINRAYDLLLDRILEFQLENSEKIERQSDYKFRNSIGVYHSDDYLSR